MATAVFLGFPGHGHVIPSLPLVAELVQRGERVIYFETADFQTAVKGSGSLFQPYGTDFPLAAPAALDHFARGLHSAVRMQLKTSAWALDRLLPEIRALQPDYILHDSLCAWGWYLAQALNKPAVSLYPTLVYIPGHRPAPTLSRRARALARGILDLPAWLQARRLRHRYAVRLPIELAQLMHSQGTLNLVFTSRAFQPRSDALDPARFKFIGPAVAPRGDAPAFPMEQLEERPLILISLGTAFQNQSAFYQTCMDAFRDTRWQIVMAVGSRGMVAPHTVPANFIVRPMVPQLELLKRTTVFITHGGMNSVNEALYYDVPLVMIPQGADHAWIAGRVESLGGGIRLDKRSVSTEALRRAVDTVTQDPAFAEAARRLGASLRATGGTNEAVEAILGLAQSARQTGRG